jgi:hypothetical protein
MCHALYLLTDRQTPATAPADPELLTFHEAPAVILSHVDGARAASYLGASSGCSCDFHGREEPSLAALADWLAALPPGITCWLYDRWEGEQHLPPTESRPCTLADLRSGDALAEGRLLALGTTPLT